MTTGPRQNGRRRHLSAEELNLWRQVTRTIAPMRSLPPVPDFAVLLDPPATRPEPMPPASVPAPQVQKPRPKMPPPLAQIEPRLRQRLRRGRTDVERAIDLHGLRQEEAHRRLRAFVHEAQRDGAKLVLVITGKGRGAEDQHESPYGVLRRAVPHWLREPDLRNVVIGFEEATATHGGGGALYVRIRRAGRFGDRP